MVVAGVELCEDGLTSEAWKATDRKFANYYRVLWYEWYMYVYEYMYRYEYVHALD